MGTADIGGTWEARRARAESRHETATIDVKVNNSGSPLSSSSRSAARGGGGSAVAGQRRGRSLNDGLRRWQGTLPRQI